MENPDMRVNSSIRVYNVALYLSNRPDLWIRICHQNLNALIQPNLIVALMMAGDIQCFCG